MIEAKGITKVYNPNSRKANTVLSDANISFPDKGFIFILGKSGSGKSTILNAVGGLVSYQGKILYDNKIVDIEQYRRKNIGYVFQDFLLFDDLSVRENIKISLNIIGIYDEEEISKRTEILLKAVGLKINSKRRASALSLGQRQRVAIARTLASNPHIILADEPTGNLDSNNSLLVMDILKKLSVDHLVICVTHNTNLVKLYADESYSIVDKKFSKIDPASQKLEDTYAAKDEIQIAKLEEKDFEDEHFIIKLFCSSSDSTKEEIKIVKQEGKILVVGNNLLLASPDKVVFNDKDSSPIKKKAQVEALDLDFDNSKVQKRTFKDYLSFSGLSKFLGEKVKRKKSAAILKFASTILPLVIIVLLSSMFMVIDEVKSSYEPSFNYGDYNIGLINDDYLNDETLVPAASLSYDKVYDLIYNQDAALVDTYAANPSYKNGSNKISVSQTKVNLRNFSVADQALSYSNNILNNTFTFNTYNIDEYLKLDYLNSSLKPFKGLGENEIVIDKAFLSAMDFGFYNSTDITSLPLKNGQTLLQGLAGTYLRLPIYTYGYSSEYVSYKIVGVCDTGLKAFFASKRTAIDLNKRLYDGVVRVDYADLSEYEIVDFKNVKNDPNYSFTSLETDGEVTYDANLKKAMEEETCKGPVCLTSSNIADLFNYQSNGLLRVNKGSYIKDNRDESKKIICFLDYQPSPTSSTIYSSIKEYLNSYLDSKAQRATSSDLPSDLQIVEGIKPEEADLNNIIGPMLIPSAINDIIKDSYNGNYSIVGVYKSDNIFSPIYTSGMYLFQESCSSQPLQVAYASSYGNNPYLQLAKSGNFLLSSNPEKTISFFNSHPEYRLKAMTYTELYNDYIYPSAFTSVMQLFIAIMVLLGVMIVILVLDSISEVNKEKRDIGVLRCLGKSKGSILLEETVKCLKEDLLLGFVPCLGGYIILVIFHLAGFNFGYFILFMLIYVLISWLSRIIPLLLVLAKKPNDIIRTLN